MVQTDHCFTDFIRDVKVSEILGMAHSFVQISTMTSLTLDLDPHVSETILILGCMISLLDSKTLHKTGRDWAVQLDKLCILFDAYLSHVIYLCPPLGQSTVRSSQQYHSLVMKLRVRGNSCTRWSNAWFAKNTYLFGIWLIFLGVSLGVCNETAPTEMALFCWDEWILVSKWCLSVDCWFWRQVCYCSSNRYQM
jgi:hypothetical protein